MRQDEASPPQPPDPAASLDRRGALRAAVLALAAASVTGCEPHGHNRLASVDGATTTRPEGASGSKSRPRPSAEPAPRASGPQTSAPRASGLPTLPPEITNGPRDRSAIALTFHGQGDPAQVRALLGELERGGARATVLAVGSWLADTPETARRILDGGHELGNHTQNHGDLASMSADEAFAEIDACATVLKRLTGSIGTWFRPSMTQYSTATIRAQAARAGYATCLSYDLDSLDNTDPGAEAVARTVSDSVRGGSIVSMHCGHDGTVAAIPAILERLRQLKLRPVTMTELVGP
ncbi:polysaccharide deacetylase family protein [Rugosimonospora africana]|uniref:Polysaccharide deacetylase n=1 Tax=Rugosimonospora africana TaxID=556532 RepID=A0A8J3VUX6_9ACTN|nr:polysaccharide deacetylase family protein [Rugosimonospora africana]GIH19138.1 polysaccharide deacetylase [Rugosimonospora africana]